jgi:hypothetical protein
MPIRSKKNNEFEDDTPLAELTEMLAGLLELARRLPDGPDLRSPTKFSSAFSQAGPLPVKFSRAQNAGLKLPSLLTSGFRTAPEIRLIQDF